MHSVHSRAPLRLGLAGGGTDVAPYSDLFGGRVLNATISLFTHCDIDPLSGGRSEFLPPTSIRRPRCRWPRTTR